MTSIQQDQQWSACLHRHLELHRVRPEYGRRRLALGVFALLVALSRQHLHRIRQARLQDFASECRRLEEHVAVLARFCPTVTFVEVLLDLEVAMALFLRRRRVTVHLVVRRLSLASALRLELALRFPTRLWAVA